MNAKKPIAAAIYLRVSLDAKNDRLAVDRQREDCQRIAQERGWKVAREYVDNSISASDKNKRRPEYDRMVDDYRAGRFAALVCYDLDRLTRQPRQLEDWIDLAEENGLLLVTANGEADLTTDGGRLFARIKASVARAEVERKSARQKRALQQRADKGKPPLGVRLTGYTVKGEVVQAEADVVAAMFARFHAGDSLRGVAAWLNTQPVKPRNSDTWPSSTVRTLLRNPRYAGRAVYQGKPTGKAGDWEPIVAEELFDSVQITLNDPRRATNRQGTARKRLGASLYFCDCGNRVRAHSGHRYRCHPSGHFTRSGAPIDELVRAVIAARLSRPDASDILATDNTAETQRLSAQIKALRGRIGQVEADYDSGHIDGRRYAVASEKIAAELKAAEQTRARATGSGSVADLLAAVDPGKAFLNAPLGIQRAIVEALITVTIHPWPQGKKGFDPDSVEIIWKGQP